MGHIVAAGVESIESSADILVTLLLCGLMGLLGQGVRAALGFKNAVAASPQTRFDGSYFATSLVIGFIAGDLAGVGIGLDKLSHFDAGNLHILIGIAAAGYAGVDFIENSFSSMVPFAGPQHRRPAEPEDPE